MDGAKNSLNKHINAYTEKYSIIYILAYPEVESDKYFHLSFKYFLQVGLPNIWLGFLGLLKKRIVFNVFNWEKYQHIGNT